MTTTVLFVQGAGDDAHAEDEALVASLRSHLGDRYEVSFPLMPAEGDPDDAEWARLIAAVDSPIVVAHSVGASIAVQALNPSVEALFLIAAPFWGGDGWRYEGWQKLALPEGFALEIPVFLYHGRDDEVVPFEHLAMWAAALPNATVREIDGVGHQLAGDLSRVADDIHTLGQ